MTNLKERYIKSIENKYETMLSNFGLVHTRINLGLRYAKLAIFINCLLAIAKFIIGSFFNMLAIQADGINNLSDCLSSVISLVSFHLAKKPADKEHPFGHARSEYIGTSILCYLIFTFSFLLIYKSLKQLQTTETISVSPILFIILLISIVIKTVLYLYSKTYADLASSPLLKAFAIDSISDIITDFVILVLVILQAVILFLNDSLSLKIPAGLIHKLLVYTDSFLAIILAIIIAINGFKLMMKIFKNLLGQEISDELKEKIGNSILSVQGVLAYHDLYIHDYGPERLFSTVHIEVDSKLNLNIAHDISDRVERKIAKHFAISLVVHLDPVDKDNRTEEEARKYAKSVLKEFDPRLSLHDFHLLQGEYYRNLCFDIRLPRDYFMKNEMRTNLEQGLAERIRDYFKVRNERDNVVVRIERENIGLPIGNVKMGGKE